MPEALPAPKEERGPLKTCLVRGLGCSAAFVAVAGAGGLMLANWLNGDGKSGEATSTETYANSSPYPQETATEEPEELASSPAEEETPTAEEATEDEQPDQQAPADETTSGQQGKESVNQSGEGCPWSPSNPQPITGNSITIFPGCMGIESGEFDTYSYHRQQMNGRVHLKAGQKVVAACAWPNQTYTGVITEDGKKALLDDRAAGYVGYVNGQPGLTQCPA